MSATISKSCDADIDARRTIYSIVLLAVLGAAMFLLQPGYVQGLVEYGRLSEEQAGLIAAAEMYGIAATAIAIYFVIDRINWRGLTYAFVLLSLLGNVLSFGQDDFDTLRVLRFLTGLGSGGLISITFTMMGHTTKIDRNMGLIVAAVLTWGALGLFTLPSLFAQFGIKGFMVVLAIFSAIGLIVIRYLPVCVPPERHDSDSRPRLLRRFRYGLLLGVLLYNLAIGIVWVYMSLVGISAGLKEQVVANIMTVSQVLGICGALITYFLEKRIGRLIPVTASIVGAAAGIGIILGQPTLLLFALGVCMFNLLWNVTQPYLVAMLASYDDDNKLVSQGVALQMIGYALGPTMAALLLELNGYDGVNRIAIAMFLGSAIIIAAVLYRLEKQED